MAALSRKDYRIIAAAIRGVVDADGFSPTVRYVACSIADALAANSGYDANGNRRFDREQFLEAAGVFEPERPAPRGSDGYNPLNIPAYGTGE